MLTSLCLSASMHSQMRLNTLVHRHTYHCHHPRLSWLHNFLLSLYLLLSLCSLLCFLLYLLSSLIICSISLCLCHDESGRGSDRHSAVTRLLREISVSFLPSILCPPLLTSLPPSFSLQQLP